jgi:transposase
VVFVGKDRKAKTLERFFNQFNAKQRNAIEAIVMDMWNPFTKAVKKTASGQNRLRSVPRSGQF